MTLDLRIGTKFDVRDDLGKWNVGTISFQRDQDCVEVSYEGWDSRWNEKIPLTMTSYRLAPFRTYTMERSHNENIPLFIPKFQVLVPFEQRWILATIVGLDHFQVQVELPKGKAKRWFHLAMHEVKFVNREQIEKFISFALDRLDRWLDCQAIGVKLRSQYRIQWQQIEQWMENMLEDDEKFALLHVNLFQDLFNL